MKKTLLSLPLIATALMFTLTASAQQNAPSTEEVGYELPSMVSEKTVPIFDDMFTNMPGVKISFYCYNLSIVGFTVDRSLQKDNSAIEQKIHSIFNTDEKTQPLVPRQGFAKTSYALMCNDQDVIVR